MKISLLQTNIKILKHDCRIAFRFRMIINVASLVCKSSQG